MKSILTLICLAALSLSAFGQGARTNSTRIYRDKIEPHWFGGSSQFWYRNDLPKNAREFVLVDAEHGTRAPAFDHARAAAALEKKLGQKLEADHLPIESIEFVENPAGIILHGDSRSWRLELANYELTDMASKENPDGDLPSSGAPRPSARTGPETEITFVNNLKSPIDLFWIDPDGIRQAYGTIEPAGRRRQHTFAGHVWIATKSGGDVAGVFEAKERAGRAVIAETVTPPQRRRGRDLARPAVPSPDRNWEAFVRGDNLCVRELDSKKETQLSFDGNPDDSYARDVQRTRAVDMQFDANPPDSPSPEVYWSPDSRWLVALRTRSGTKRQVYLIESSPKDQLQPKLESYPYLKPGDAVPIRKPHLFDVRAGRELTVSDELFANPWSITDLRWRPDSSAFTFVFNQRGHQVLRLLAIEAPSSQQHGAEQENRSGKKSPGVVAAVVRPIIEERSGTFIDYSGKFFCESLATSAEVVWMSERDGWNHLYLYDAATGQLKNQITKGEWVVRGVERVDKEKRQIWFRGAGMRAGEDPYFIEYGRVNFDGSGLVWLTEGQGTHSIQFSPDRRFLIDAWSRVDQPPVNELRRAEDGKLVCHLEKADATELFAAGWKPPEPFVAKGRDGATDIYGVIFRPRQFDPEKKYPVIESIYAGPHDSFVPKSFRSSYPQQRLADRGFVVVQMDGMGTSNRSKKFHDVCWQNIGDAGFPDRILWIKTAAAKHPFIDLTRVGIYGTSAGGQNALRGLLAHGDFYKAGVADCGCHDNRMDKIWWNEQWMGWPVGPHYEEQSNVTQAHRFEGKLLLMVGELDKNVDPSSTMQVVNALIKADKDFELLVMPGAGHGVARTPYGWRRLENFFARSFLEGNANAGSRVASAVER